MEAFDRLSPKVRAWLSEAALPCSPRSARRAWRKALDDARGNEDPACARLSQIEAGVLLRNAPRVWAEGYPARDRAL